jgi:type III restriction enzyme
VAVKSIEEPLPIQPVPKPILCSPFKKPDKHWLYNPGTGQPTENPGRREAGYWYKTERTGLQRGLFTEEQRDDLPLINALRKDVDRWREAKYRGASNVTKELLRHWSREDRGRRLFFCQLEAVETMIYLNELRIPGRSSRTGFQNFELSDEDLALMLAGKRPRFYTAEGDYFPRLVDPSPDAEQIALRRLGCKMATGSGKTVVMSMLIAWAFCNRGVNPGSIEFPNGVLVVCPNLTVKERLQVLKPENSQNYYDEFDVVPVKYRPLMQKGKVFVTNWHTFNPRSEHEEGGKSYAVVNKGPDTPESYARWVLGELYDRMPVMVLNDEGHHCWRRPVNGEVPEPKLTGEEGRDLKEELEEATVWIDGLDKLNNANPRDAKKPGLAVCVDLSATPFYIGGSGHPEGRPFPWLVSDFGLVDAIESGIVKIPRLPVMDTTGLPDPKYFKLWERAKSELVPSQFHSGKNGRPKAGPLFDKIQGALVQLSGQWKGRFEEIQNAKPGQEFIPPVMIVVCDNTEIAEVCYRKISGETEEDEVTLEDVQEVAEEENGEEAETPARKKGKKAKKRIVYGQSEVREEFANTPARQHTIRIDTKRLDEVDEDLRAIVSTVGRKGLPGEHVRCVVSVGMLTEGWDANNVTNILGIRAFGSQLLCEQVVGRGLRRMDYRPDPETGMFAEEYVDVYGIPFSVIPFKGKTTTGANGDDKPINHVRALPERAPFEMRFPVVEGFAFALSKNLIACNVEGMEPLQVEPSQEPTGTFLSAPIGYREGNAAVVTPFDLLLQDRQAYYRDNHLQTIKFRIAQVIVEQLSQASHDGDDRRARVFRLQSKHQLFPQVFRFVDEYVERRVDFQGAHPSELGLSRYTTRIVERLMSAIQPDESQGEPPLMPILNRYKPLGTTAEVEFPTTKPCFPTTHSHINQVVADTLQWEQSAAFHLEAAALRGLVKFYAKNDHVGLTIQYEYFGVPHNYEPDFLVRLKNGVTLLLEIKGQEDNRDRAKHDAAQRWVTAGNNWGKQGIWALHVCRNPNVLEQELEYILQSSKAQIIEK